MHYVLVGPGALGCLLGSVAARGLTGDDQLTILDYNYERAEHIAANGIVYEKDGEKISFPVRATSDPSQLGIVDVVVVCVKSYDVASCLDFCGPAIGEKTLLLFMQNGIGHLAFENSSCGGAAAFGTTTEGATRLGPGHVRHAGKGLTLLGFLSPQSDYFKGLLQKTCDLFMRGTMEVEITEDILAKLWAKLFINVGINALTAILQCKNGELLTIPGAIERMEKAVKEAMQVARTKSITIGNDPIEATKIVCQKTAANVSSMLQDVRNKKRTEIGAINGAVVNFATELRIETPENQNLVQQVRDIESGY